MSKIMNFTDSQWYNFICGFNAGLKLRDLSLPPYQLNINPYPLNIGGDAIIGLGMPDILYSEDIQEYSIPVYTHDVNIKYSGFSVNISWDTSRLQFISVSSGGFGTIGTTSSTADIRYTYSGGVFKARGLRNETVEFNDAIILFYINVKVIGIVTKTTPIQINFNNSSNSSIEYTTLLKYVDMAGVKYTYFITPLQNKNGLITSDLEDKVQHIDETTVSALASPSSVEVFTVSCEPGNTCVVPVVACSNINDNFPYDRVHFKLEIDDSQNMSRYISFTPMQQLSNIYYELFNNEEYKGMLSKPFNVNIIRSINTNTNNLVLDITCTRDYALKDSSMLGYLTFGVSVAASNNYNIPLLVQEPELINTTEDRNFTVEGVDGAIYYTTEHQNKPENNHKDSRGNKSTGGLGASGKIFSSTDQVIYFNVGGFKYPIYLKAGYNNIEFNTPFIYNQDIWIDTNIEIEATGYILIPAGFEWEVIIDEQAPLPPVPQSKLSDAFKPRDFIKTELFKLSPPIDTDNLIEELTFEDNIKIETYHYGDQVQSNYDDLNLEDDVQLVLVKGQDNKNRLAVEEVVYTDITKIDTLE